MTERTTVHPTEAAKEIEKREAADTKTSHRMFVKPTILQPYNPAESMTVPEAASKAGISERQMRTWCPTHRIGRKIGGRYHVSRPLFTMHQDGDTGAQDDHLHGDRTSERVIGYIRRLGINSD